MKEFFKKFNIVKGVSSLVLFVLGLCLIFAPNTTILTLCYIVGVLVLIFGIVSVVSYYVYGLRNFGFIIGITEISIGVLVLIFARQITSPQVFSLVIGVMMLITGLFKIQDSMDSRRLGLKFWWVYLVYSLVLVGLSIVLLAYPFAGQKLLLIFLGIALVIEAILEIISMIVVKEKIKIVTEKLNEDVIEIDNKNV